MFPSISPKQSFPALESEVLAYWKANNTFQKSIDSRPSDNPYRFYDGPPFITGTPHYGNLLSSIVKDVVGRYWTMRGKRVDRVWGWDCHGLPIEEKVQKKLGLKSNKEIEERGVKEFIDGCYEYTKTTSYEWDWYIDKIGRWVDMDRAYRTMDQEYMESVMWVFSQLWDKGLIYEGKRVSLYSWKLGTPISNFEVAMDDTYQEVNDPAITVKFELEKNDKFPEGTQILAWTTTPWTIPANMALAVRNDIDYVLVDLLEKGGVTNVVSDGGLVVPKDSEHQSSASPAKRDQQLLSQGAGAEQFIVAKNRAESVFKGKGEYTITREFKGSELVGLGYIPPFPEYYYDKKTDTDTQKNDENNPDITTTDSDVSSVPVSVTGSKNHRIYHADFITDTDGTGIGHEAPEFGDVDFQLAKKEGISISEAMDEAGRYTSQIFDYEGTHYLNLEEPEKGANRINIERMKANGTLFKLEGITHRVPFCPRSGTPLVQKAQKSWFIDIQSQKEKLLKANEQINWFPEHLKFGRFAKGIESAPDWCISRTRYWGAPMPVWQNADASERVVVSSREEIYEMSKPYGQLTKLIIARHAESQANVERHYDDVGTSPLSKKGITQAELLIEELKDAKIDVIISSPFLRAVQTAEPLAKELGIEIITDARLKETDHGIYANASYLDEEIKKKIHKERDALFLDKNAKFGETGECYLDIEKRMQSIIDEICEKYPGKTVFIVSHGFPVKIATQILTEKNAPKETQNAKTRTFILDVANKKQLNLHKPYIDAIKLQSTKTGEALTRIPEVLDVWMDSGSMPYAQMHYPFENKGEMEASFPADFIAEYVGQVRAWFYVMHVLGVLLGDLLEKGGGTSVASDGGLVPLEKTEHQSSVMSSTGQLLSQGAHPRPAFTNVITTGVINGNDGRKMSKSYGNYPDPRLTIEKYGADPIRFYMLNSPLLSGGDMDFKEEQIIETVKGVMLPLWNTYSFFTTYANIDSWKKDDTRIWYCRHGETASNAAGKMSDASDDPELTALGRTQASSAGKTFRENNEVFDVIIHTGLSRTTETAKIIGSELGYSGEYIVDTRFYEHDAGEYAGKTHIEIAEFYSKKTGNPVPTKPEDIRKIYRNNDTENIEQFEKRILEAFDDIKKKYSGKRILIVAHSGVARPFFHKYLGHSLEDAYYIMPVKNTDTLLIPSHPIVNNLDRWILSKLQVLLGQVHDAMDGYDISRACRAIVDYMDHLTNGYVRLSRRRFWESGMTEDKASAYETLHTVLVELSKVLAPYMPFLAESVYKGLTDSSPLSKEGAEGSEAGDFNPKATKKNPQSSTSSDSSFRKEPADNSVHLEYVTFPSRHLIANVLNRDMEKCENIVSLGLALRSQKNIRVRQPLQSVTITAELDEYYQSIIRDELNVKEIRLENPEKLAKKICKPDARKIGPKYGKDVQKVIIEAKNGNFVEKEDGIIDVGGFILEPGEYSMEYIQLEGVGDVTGGYGMVVALDTVITEELKLEGYARDIIRLIQDMRKESGYEVTDRINLSIIGEDSNLILSRFGKMIESETLSTLTDQIDNPDTMREESIDEDNVVQIAIKR